MWVFVDPKESGGRKVLHGSYADGRNFTKQCEDLGLIVRHVNFSVPFSNGKWSGDYLAREKDLFIMGEVPDLDTLARLARSVL